ncbi:MAG TPA: helical backbone metal receptor [Acidobacteriota bacterium]|nr:helical backbone metal receptor [Acidobacteriota bacterium]
MRIVSLVPSITETLFELGLDDEIVGITTFCQHPKNKVATKIKVGGTKNPDRQKILDLHPDVILLNEEENRKEDADFFRSQGIPLKVSFPSTVVEAAELVKQLGDDFGASEKGEALHDAIINASESTGRNHNWKTLILIWKRPYWTVNATTYVHSICKTVGLENVFAQSKDRYPLLTDADIVEADPELVLFPDEPYVFREKDVSDFKEQFPKLKAVTANRLLKLNGSYLTWHGVRTLKALHQLPLLLREFRQ